MDFFAMVSDQQTIYRIDIHQEIQKELTTQFKMYSEKMLSEDLTVVPFQKENFKPDETEVLEITPFDLPELLYEPLQNAIGWKTLPLDDETISKIYCVFAYDQQNDLVIYQAIRSQQRLTRGHFNLVLSGNTFKKLDNPGLVLGHECHAVFQRNALRFKNLWWLSHIIDIGEYYREATDSDVDEFCSLAMVKVEDPEKLKKTSGKWTRTRIAYILDSKKLERFTPEQLLEKAQQFPNIVLLRLHTEEDGTNKLIIPENGRELRSILKFLEDELYLGPITGEAFEANSKRQV